MATTLPTAAPTSARAPKLARKALHLFLTLVGGALCTLTLFVALPIIEAATKQKQPDTLIRSVGTANLPQPETKEKEEEKQEEKKEEKPPPKLEEAPPLDLAQLDLLLNPEGFAGGGWGSDINVKLDSLGGGAQKSEQTLFALADLDQTPRATYQPGPNMTSQVRRAGGGTVHVLFIVGASGRVERPKVAKSTNPGLDQAALNTVRKWRFQPGKRNGKPVAFKMRVPITFPGS